MKRNALWVMLLFLIGCGKGAGTPSLPTGTKITNEHSFWSRVLPAYRPGMSWTYRRGLDGSGSLGNTVLSIEVAEVKDSLAFLKVTGWMEPATISIQSPTKAMNAQSAAYESLGSEDVTVPFGVYKGAAKFRFYPDYKTRGVEAETYLWFAQGVGLVKTTDIREIAGKTTVVTQELTEFKK